MYKKVNPHGKLDTSIEYYEWGVIKRCSYREDDSELSPLYSATQAQPNDRLVYVVRVNERSTERNNKRNNNSAKDHLTFDLKPLGSESYPITAQDWKLYMRYVHCHMYQHHVTEVRPSNDLLSASLLAWIPS